MRVVGSAAALALALPSVCLAAPAGLASGLRGVVMRGPTKPVCSEAEPCEEPAAGVAPVLPLEAGRRAGADNRGRGLPRAAASRQVHGHDAAARHRRRTDPAPGARTAGRIARVDFHLDTGIQ